MPTDPPDAAAVLTDHPALAAVLHEHGRLGFFGPAGVPEELVRHALGFLGPLRPGTTMVDLGSGGGVPGLVLACVLPSWTLVLVEGSATRADALERAVGRLGMARRVVVDRRPAEVVGRDPGRRAAADAVVARSFGPPGVTAEAAAPLLSVGGQLVVSEPPGNPDRWPTEGLRLLELTAAAGATPGVRSFTLGSPVADRFPRRRLRPPLF
jgi:16S rRNA (guanine527-N7)-methyltransferase